MKQPLNQVPSCGFFLQTYCLKGSMTKHKKNIYQDKNNKVFYTANVPPIKSIGKPGVARGTVPNNSYRF